jgi:hypothetical protein
VSNREIIDAFLAENLLPGSHLFTRLEKLRDSMCYSSEGTLLSFDDFYTLLKREADSIPSLRLENDIAPGTENQYTHQLITSMETINDDSDRVLRKIHKFHSKLKAAEGQIKEERTGFAAWYILAANTLLASHKIKFSSTQIKDLADSEFTRLVHSLDIEVKSLSIEVGVLASQVDSFKKTQQSKFALGKEQVSATWTSHLPAFGGAVAPSRSDQLLQRPSLDDEELEDGYVPAFISKTKPTLVEPTVMESIKPDADGTLPIKVHTEDDEIIGVFKKVGDPRPIHRVRAHDDCGDCKLPDCHKCTPAKPRIVPTANVDDAEIFGTLEEDFLEDKKLATPVPTTPRKKLTFEIADDEDIL